MLLLVALATLYPFWYLVVVSFSTREAYYADRYHVIPLSFSLDSYRLALYDPGFLRSFGVTLVSVAGGVVLGMLLTSMGGYALSKKYLRGRSFFFSFILLTMFFNGGLVPYYLLVARTLRMNGSILAYFLPTVINAFYLILMKNYFLTIPESLEDSAKIDGCNDMLILFRIVLPTAAPIVMTLTLFYTVYFWNDFFQPLLFASNQKMYPLALFIRNRIGSASNFDAYIPDRTTTSPEKDIASFLLLSIAPIIVAYPFVQKYFVQGIMLGSVKE
jgi:putative aldouronate transport system permease protein